MYKATILYGHPDDPEAFDRYYREVHIPIARQMQGLTGWTITWLEPDVNGNPPEYYLIAELWAESRQALQAILASEAGQAAARDVEEFATGGAALLFGPAAVGLGGGDA